MIVVVGLVKDRNRLGWVLVILLITVSSVAAWFILSPLIPPVQVFLNVPAGSDQVQMFDRLGVTDKEASHFFPDRTVCTVIERRVYYEAAGIPLEFYKLDCGGTIGYVNSRWVSPY
jgi:hypothetical protein